MLRRTSQDVKIVDLATTLTRYPNALDATKP